jgi:hypothetical protein
MVEYSSVFAKFLVNLRLVFERFLDLLKHSYDHSDSLTYRLPMLFFIIYLTLSKVYVESSCANVLLNKSPENHLNFSSFA